LRAQCLVAGSAWTRGGFGHNQHRRFRLVPMWADG
jgi:hypothetical protein